MSKSVKRVLKNSFFQTFGAFSLTALNLFLLLGYARILGPESFGSRVTSQAQVLVWGWLVDLGLSNSLISALTRAEGIRSEQERQGFRAPDLLFRVLGLRVTGAAIGMVGILLMGGFRQSFADPEFLQRLSYCPFLFASALLQTAMAYANFNGRQALAVISQIIGVSVTVALPLYLARQHYPIHLLLLAQSWGGFLSAAIIFGFFFFASLQRRRAGNSRRVDRFRQRGPWAEQAWLALANDAWPYAITFGATVIWQRLDQIVASSVLGYELGGQYAMAVRLTAIPILFASAISIAVFPDLQKLGRDNPQRMRVILGAISKAIYRYGILLVALLLVTVAFVLVPVVPKFRPALRLLPFFVPGVWAFWLQASVVNALFGMREYTRVVRAHIFSVLIYVPSIFTLPHFFALQGVVWSFNIFCLSMCGFSLLAARRAGLFHKGFTPFSAFTPEELALWRSVGIGRLIRGKTA
jgi:O-antigen/teichoic acid export membrane protein